MTDETDNDSNDVNISKLRELALRGKNYREEFETEYLGESLTLYLKPLTDLEFLPIAAFLEDKLDMDAEEAKERIEEEREAGEDNSIDVSNFDKEFVGIMQEAAAKGVDTTQGDAEGLDEDMVLDTIRSLIGGKSIEIAEKVLDIFPATRRTPRSFADSGAAGIIFGLKSEVGAGFVGCDSQLEMTPFQRQVFEAEKVREHQEQERQMEAARGGNMGGGGRTPNAAHPSVPSSGNKRSRRETVRYVNDSPDENPEANVTFVD
ncbi:tail assembly chaperone [Halorubrum virus HRTV-15]|nr:tail assembly chaperone [Halorubrum virus HRTV-15]